MSASNVPGYQQGFRFNSANYNADHFPDLAGYGVDARATTINGSPTFETINGHEGLLLDNTHHMQFYHPNVWEGTVVIVSRHERIAGGTLTKLLLAFSSDGVSGVNGRLRATYFGASRSVFAVTAGALSGGVSHDDGIISVTAICFDQTRGKAYASVDGISIAETNGNPNNGVTQNLSTNLQGGIIGALSSGGVGNTTAETDTINHLFELHFFRGNPLVDHAAEMQTFLSDLDVTY